MRKWIAAILVAAVLLFVTCTNPLDEAMLLHVRDVVRPVITITSPH
jgi:hypothetical protein